MSTVRATFNLQSIGYYPKSKAVYLTVTPDCAQNYQKISILLDRTDSNLEKLGKIVAERKTKIQIVVDPSSRTVIPDKGGRDTVRFRGIEIEAECEPSKLNFFSQALN